MPNPPNPRDVLVLHAGALGDCVLTLHVVAAMKATWSRASVTMASRSPIARWARSRGLLDDVVSLESINAHLLFRSAGELPREMVGWLNRFECVVSFLGSPEEPVSRRLSRLHRETVVSIDPKPNSETVRQRRHITEQWIRDLDDAVLNGFGGVSTSGEFAGSGGAARLGGTGGFSGAGVFRAGNAVVNWEESERGKLRDKLRSQVGGRDRPVAILHPGSGSTDKCCPIEVLERLTKALRDTGWVVGWMVGPDEVERFGPAYARRLESSAPVFFEESVEAAADLVGGTDAYIGHDAGMTHVAAIAGVKTLAIFGPTDSRVWCPLGPRVEVLGFPPPDGETDSWVRAARSRIASSG